MRKLPIRFSDEEKKLSDELHAKGAGVTEIAKELNTRFHNGIPVRNAASVHNSIKSRKKDWQVQ
ncbi:hypothetical protein ACP26L_01230 [Paenibacillus sp. S-38]|uniref:hypothetical protein n=1 Tax=Paenibacillus sp. S-38 TaxID=3416710 RepID=UPI003CF50CA1